jgi:hypothetical protein
MHAYDQEDSTDYDDPAIVNLRLWGAAISDWHEAHPESIEAILRDTNAPIPDFARRFLADVVAGKTNKGAGGRPTKFPLRTEKSIVYEYFALSERMSNEKARGMVSDRRNMSDKTLEKILARMAEKGITLEKWISMGRP